MTAEEHGVWERARITPVEGAPRSKSIIMTVINEGRFSACGSLSLSPTEDSDSDRILQSAKPPNPLATACQFNRDVSFILHPRTDTQKGTQTTHTLIRLWKHTFSFHHWDFYEVFRISFPKKHYHQLSRGFMEHQFLFFSIFFSV